MTTSLHCELAALAWLVERYRAEGSAFGDLTDLDIAALAERIERAEREVAR